MRTNKRSAWYLVFMIRLVLLRITAPSKVSHRIIMHELNVGVTCDARSAFRRVHPLVGSAFPLANSPLDVAAGLHTSMCKLVCPLYDFALSGGVWTSAWKRPLIESIFPGLIPSVRRMVARRCAQLKVENRDSSVRRFLISDGGDTPLSVRALY